MAADTGLVVVEVGEAERDAWTTFVSESPFGSAYALPAYLDALASAAGGKPLIVVAKRGETIAGGVAVLERSAQVGRFVASRFLLFYNGFVLREYETRYPSQRVARQSEVVDALAAFLLGRGYGRLELHSREPFHDARALIQAGWSVTPSYSYVAPLDDLELLWARVDQNLRRLVERARTHGLELVVDEDFDSFHRLHAATGDRKGAPLYLPYAAFREYYERLSAAGLCVLFHARTREGVVAASQLVLLGHPVTHTVCAAADASLLSSGANPFLRWSVFEYLAARGYRANDLTGAVPGGPTRFKSQLGGDLTLSLVAERPETLAYRAQLGLMRGARRVRAATLRR